MEHVRSSIRESFAEFRCNAPGLFLSMHWGDEVRYCDVYLHLLIPESYVPIPVPDINDFYGSRRKADRYVQPVKRYPLLLPDVFGGESFILLDDCCDQNTGCPKYVAFYQEGRVEIEIVISMRYLKKDVKSVCIDQADAKSLPRRGI